MHISDSAIECFDYITNTRNTYDLLGQALALLIRRAKREKHSIEGELTNPCGDRTLHLPEDRGPRRVRVRVIPGWLRTIRACINLARKDYLKFFAEEDPRPRWLESVDEKQVLLHALSHRDWWLGTKEERKRPPDLQDEKGIKAIIALQALVGITETEEKARKGWRAMKDWEKERTLAAHATLIGGKT